MFILISITTFAQDNTEKEIETIPFMVLDTPPVFPGCEKEQDKKKCFMNSVNKFVTRRIDSETFSKLGLKSGILKIHSTFIINQEGKVSNIKVTTENAKVSEIYTKVIESLPLMTTGKMKEKAINTKYVLPYRSYVD